ncbi:glycerate kinase [Microbacterium aoyamense]|uniref:Glycerate kinase n=1 Tax=Microbacterium aoyamense TaxID=344166 RepID=A0ABN2PLL5_9MICO|nr:glycerate kinase [Microbacterium aoyamense]
MRVVFAPDSFKGSIAAAAAAAALAEGWASVRPDDPAVLLPMADGGEGTIDAFAAAVPGTIRVPIAVTGPDAAAVDASFLRLPDGTAVVELASTSGIELLGDRRLPWDAHTIGFGQAIAAALDAGATRLVLGIGSSASTDGGTGMLSALGARFLDAAGDLVPDGARGLARIARVDLTGLRPMPERGVLVLSDVTNPLLGPTGAAAVFGPQKGLDAADVADVDVALASFASLVEVDAATPGAGAAGGTGFALLAWGARLAPGSVEVADLIGLAAAMAAASVVITGEGSFDAQSAGGKAPAQVATIAAETGTRAGLVAGRIAPDAVTSAFAASVSLTSLAGSSTAALADPARWLRAAGAELALRLGA